MIHPHTELRFVSSSVGLGVFATREIPRGTVVWVLDPFDLRLSDAAIAALPRALRETVLRHSYVGGEGDLVFCWDHGRYVNHSCSPNCVELGQSFEVATRTIAPGEELSCDYDAIGTLLSFDCRCGAPRCRGRVGPRSLSAAESGGPSSTLAAAIEAVAQPLLDFAEPEIDDIPLLRALRRAS